MKASCAVALLVFAGIAVAGLGQQIPTAEQCENSFDDATEDALTSSLTPCAIGTPAPGDTCCSALTATVNLASGNALAGCLCQQSILDQVGGVLEANPLASAVGFDMARLTQVLSTCGADFVGNNGCNQAPPPPAPVESTPAPAAPTTPETPATPTPTPTPAPPTQPAAPRPKATAPRTMILTTRDEVIEGPQVVYKTAPKPAVVETPVYAPEYHYNGPFPILHSIKDHIHRKIGGFFHHPW